MDEEKTQEQIDAETKEKEVAAKEEQGFKDELLRERKKRQELEALLADKQLAEAKVKEPEPVIEEDDLATAEGWKKFIDKKSTESLKPVLGELEAFKERQKQKALATFISRHPEYEDEAKRQSLMSIYDKVKGTEIDADDILESYEGAWAYENRKVLQQQETEIKKMRQRTEMDIADIAASGSSGGSEKSSREDTGATQSDYRSAREAGMPIEKYMKLKKQLEESDPLNY